MNLNDFLIAIFNSFASCGDAPSYGDTSYWERQYQLWQEGVRGVDIHDQTCKVMAEHDGRMAAPATADEWAAQYLCTPAPAEPAADPRDARELRRHMARHWEDVGEGGHGW